MLEQKTDWQSEWVSECVTDWLDIHLVMLVTESLDNLRLTDLVILFNFWTFKIKINIFLGLHRED